MMGRAKMKMELIEKEKSRIDRFKKRKEGLMKKFHQFTTLCDVPTCIIVYDPTTNSSSIWPENSGKVRRLIDAYKARNKEFDGKRLYGLPNFFKNRQKQIEGELVQLRKSNLEAKFPSWDDSLCFMDESQLRNLGAALRGKAAAVQSRIDSLKNMMAYPNLGQFYSLDAHEINNASVMEMVWRNSAAAELPVSVPNYCYHEINNDSVMEMVWRNSAAEELPVGVPNYYYYAPPPLPLQLPEQHYMLPANVGYSSMDENVNGWGDYGDGLTRYLLH